MRDPRIEKLCELIATHSLKLRKGDRVLIETFDMPEQVPITMIEVAARHGAEPLITTKSRIVLRELLRRGGDEAIRLTAEAELARMKSVNKYVAFRGSWNDTEWADLAADQLKRFTSLWMKPVHFQQRVPKTDWTVLRWPTPSAAQAACTSTEAFEDFYFETCLLDYARLAGRILPLKERMEAADRVQLRGPGTDLSFSTKDIPVVPCFGLRNIPDGECFTAPVRESVEGVIQFNTPTLYLGTTYRNVRLEFRKGRIVKASSELHNDKLQEVFDTDDGARYVGEFSLGLNPRIREPMTDILFDEKICGSLHLTPGNAYEDADNGNRSEVHWDLILIQRQDYGGGSILFDGQVIRRDGLFVTDALKPLNPDNW